MAELVKVNGHEYPAEISGKMKDDSWDGRESKTIKFENNVMTYEDAMEIFTEEVSWSIISVWEETIINPETGEEETIERREEFDNSDFNVAGAVTNCRDGGTVLVTMGKLTEIESLINDIYGEVE